MLFRCHLAALEAAATAKLPLRRLHHALSHCYTSQVTSLQALVEESQLSMG
jgi:hypothetical protein